MFNFSFKNLFINKIYWLLSAMLTLVDIESQLGSLLKANWRMLFKNLLFYEVRSSGSNTEIDS